MWTLAEADGQWRWEGDGAPDGAWATRAEALAAAAPARADGRPFTITLTEGEDDNGRAGVTVDGRVLVDGAINFDRTPPLPLMATADNLPAHQGATLIGSIEQVTRNGPTIVGTGHLFASAADFVVPIESGALGRWSPDIGDVVAEFECTEMDDDGFCTGGVERLLDGTLLGGTVVPFPALDSAFITLGGGVTASAAAEVPPAAWFDDPALDGPTPLVVTDDGQVYGHLALWDTCHTGNPAMCVCPPSSSPGYPFFRTGCVHAAGDDGTVEVSVGQLTVGGGHADLGLAPIPAAAHYDDAGAAVADVVAGEDAHGIWVAGAVRPSATPDQIRILRASSLSGDWRPLDDRLELVAVLAVNSPGFPVPRTLVASGRPVALVAAGAAPLTRARLTRDPVESALRALSSRLDALEAQGRALEPIAASAARQRLTGP